MKIVRHTAPTAILDSSFGNNRIAITVVSDAAKVLTKLLHSKIKLIKRSGRCNNLLTLMADRFFCLTKCLKRYLFSVIKDVSEPEKNADKSNIKASTPKSTLKGISFKMELASN